MSRRASIFVLFVCLIVCLVCVAYPMYVIWPFRTQGAAQLAAALVVVRIRPLVTILAVLAALAALVFYWRAQPRLWRRLLAASGALFVGALAALARVNIYEFMFHPDVHPSFLTTARARLENDQKVLAVKIGGEARAYPVRIMAYHHLINDTLGKLAIVPTY